MRTVPCGLPVRTIISESPGPAAGRLLFHGSEDRWHPQNACAMTLRQMPGRYRQGRLIQELIFKL